MHRAAILLRHAGHEVDFARALAYTRPALIDAFGPVVLLLCAGLLLARAKVLPEGASHVLNQVVIWVCLPAAILEHVPSMEWSLQVLWLAAVPWSLALLAGLGVVAAARALGFDRSTEGALMMTVALGNTSFLGYPVVRSLLGEEALASAVIYDQLGSFLLLSTYGSVVLARYGGERTPSVLELGKKVLRFPPFVALVLALLFAASPLSMPSLLSRPIELCSSAMLPLVLLALGLGLKLSMPSPIRGPLFLGLALKLLVLPALVLGTLVLLGMHGQAPQVAVLESAMPPMITAGVLAANEKLAPELSIAMTGIGLLIAMLTLPLSYLLAQSLL